MGRAGRKEIAAMHIRMCVSMISVLTWGGAGWKEITEMHTRTCVSVIPVLTWGAQGERKSLECTYACVFQ